MVVRAFGRTELRFPGALDPRPSWTHGGGVLDAVQATAPPPTHIKQPTERARSAREKAFVMRVEEEFDTEEEFENDAKDARAPAMISVESGEDELDPAGGAPYRLMERRSLEKSVLLELERQHRLKVQEEVRNNRLISSLDQDEMQRTVSAFARLQTYAESRKELDTRLDVQFRRRIAQELDRHLSTVQRDHEQRSQIVERGIRDDAAAVEEGKNREEQSMKEDRTRQETEARQKEVAKLEAEAQKAAYEAAEMATAKSRAEAVSTPSQILQNSGTHARVANSIEIRSELPGIKVYAGSSALEAESRRRALHDQASSSNIYLSKEYRRYDLQIGKSIGKLMPTTDSVRARASELINALDGQDCPRPIACRLFADKMISIVKSRNTREKTFDNLAFACGFVMLLVADEVPDAMDYLLAEFHKVCMYTVPKHLHALNAQARNMEYYRLIGYQEEDGNLQSTEAYLVNVVAYVKLYAAMIQTEIKGIRHPHGLAEGWKWLAVFLNTLPAITATAFALHAFLKMAGFALHKKYGSQFMKILDVISQQYIPALKEQGPKVQPEAINNLQNYLNDKNHLEEPEGQHLVQQLWSKVFL